MDSGQDWKNLPLSRIVEDPFYKNSAQSFFVQIVDFAAYALLRRENQILSKNRYGVHQMFDILDPILVRESSTYDPQGIIRLPQKELQDLHPPLKMSSDLHLYYTTRSQVG